MDIASLINLLDHPDQASHWLSGWGLRDADSARSRLSQLLEHGLTLDLLAAICGQLAVELRETSDPDAVLAALADFVSASRSPLALAALFQRDPEALPMLLKVLDLGAHWRRMLVADPEAFDLLRLTDGQPVSGPWLRNEVCNELAHFSDERHVLAGLRRIKQRELLRIIYGDLHKRQRVELVTEQLTILADALLEAAVQAARRKLQERGEPKRASGWDGRLAILALGRLGGFEMDYSNRLELLLIHEPLPEDDHVRRAAKEYFDRFGRLIVRYLSEPLDGQLVYSVDLPIQIEQQSGPVTAADELLSYLDRLGRTWHREAVIKARSVAGDSQLAGHLVRQLQPWVYRRYLNRADETGTRALKRRLQRRTMATTQSLPEIPLMTRQTEGVVQFLQLLNGGDLPIVHASNTLAAIAGLEQAGVLSVPERIALEDDYRTLRVGEHRLQLAALADPSEPVPLTGSLPERAVRGGSHEPPAALVQALQRARETTAQLLSSAFPGDVAPPPEADLLLDPEPTEAEVHAVLAAYGFRDELAAYHRLQGLASEHVPFLSTRRCRYFLAAIAPQLLSAIAATPDPDYTLANLSVVSDSIGGKGVLWELFSFNPPSLQLYVRLCAASPYLSGILTGHPGMVDELVDSLQLAQSPTRAELDGMLAELSRSNRDQLALLHGFKHSQHLQIGVRELLGKETIESTHRALSDVAEACLMHLVEEEYARLTEKFGVPTQGDLPDSVQTCRYAVLATGKVGGREPNYHSDVEFVLVYEMDGMTMLVNRGRREAKTTNAHFFSQLVQRVIKNANQLTPWGRLYNADAPLRSASGAPAISLAGLMEKFETGPVSLAERQALCKSRPISAEGEFPAQVATSIKDLLSGHLLGAAEIRRHLADRLERSVDESPLNLKRSAGGAQDVELLTAALQLQHAGQAPEVLVAGTLEAISALRSAGHLNTEHAEVLARNYRWIRQVESALRLLNAEPRHNLPTDEVALRKLAILLRVAEPDQLQARTIAAMQENLRLLKTLLPDNEPSESSETTAAAS